MSSVNGDSEKPFERQVQDLTKEERAILEAIKGCDDIKTCEVLAAWTDDHEQCVGVKLNGVEVGFWWISHEGVAAFLYADESTKAKIIVCEILQDALENNPLEEEDEERVLIEQEDEEEEALKKIENVAQMDDNKLMKNYSGRGMFGAICWGIICDNPNDVIAKVGLAGAKTDNMGRSWIVYWPRITGK